MPRKRPEELRSHRWFGVNDLRSFGHRSRLRQFGYDAADWAGKPVIGIINTWSDINACHGHLRARAEDVKRGVLQAGGLPIELPAMSLAEPMVKPSTMLYRNFLAMETEELLRSHPIDGAVLMGGCDKTTPGLVMGAISMGLPAIYVPAGPCCAATGAARRSAPARTPGNTGTKSAPAASARRTGPRSRAASRAVRHLHGDGHRRHHDGDHRGARPGVARRLIDPGGRCEPPPDVRRLRPAHRRHGVGGFDPGANPHPRRLRQCHPSPHGDGRLHQRHHPPGGDGPPRRHSARHAALRRDFPRNPGARQCARRREST